MRAFVVVVMIAAVAVAAVGCSNVSKPYVMKTDRVDQKLEEGNRGYLKGTPPPVGDRGDLKRPWIAVDVDLPESSGASSAAASATAVRRTSCGSAARRLSTVRVTCQSLMTWAPRCRRPAHGRLVSQTQENGDDRQACA